VEPELKKYFGSTTLFIDILAPYHCYLYQLEKLPVTGREDSHLSILQVVKPEALPWYPDRMAYQLNLTRKDIRREELYFKLHNFLVAESGAYRHLHNIKL
jgi:hypothetical protein